jgi:hypothetical protein
MPDAFLLIKDNITNATHGHHAVARLSLFLSGIGFLPDYGCSGLPQSLVLSSVLLYICLLEAQKAEPPHEPCQLVALAADVGVGQRY